MYGYTREAIRVKVKKCEMNCSPEWRKFSVDPQITSVDVLHSIVAKAFDIRSDFSIFYRTLDPLGHETFLAVLSDWDLDAAFLRTHNYSVQTGSEPCLNLRVDVKSLNETSNFERNTTETYKLDHSSIQQSIGVGQKYVQTMQNKLPGIIMNHMEKTFSMVQRALNFAEEQIPIGPPRVPLSDSEFRGFLDSVGQIVQPQELRKVIFLGGIDPSLRRVVWKHILNVYPDGMTGRERMDYMKRKALEYNKLRDIWKTAVQEGSNDSELAYVTSMVKKDVLRTDRLHQFYAGSDDNQNIASLFNILTTYALNHPKVSYCQGMSDLASPLLVTMNDEAHAYICFCAIMERLQANFMLDGIAMTQKFAHLTEALQYYDPEFYDYLKLQQADDLLFCYRWLLLELKREFPFEDSLRMLEVQWSSLRSDPPDKELNLFDKEFIPQTEITNCVKQIQQNSLITSDCQRKHRENHYANICALRRQTSSLSLHSNIPSKQPSFDYLTENINDTKLDRFKRLNHSLDENISRVPLRRTNLMKAHQSLDETKMLLLMRNITLSENFTDPLNNLEDVHGQNIPLSNDKSKKNLCDKKNNENKKIIFHSTNPFIDDAQGGSTEILVCDDRVEQKNLENIQSNLENIIINRTENFSNIDKNLLNDSNKVNCSIKSESIISAQIINKHKGHFKELKEKIAASKKGILASIDKIETHLDLKTPMNQNSNDDEFYKQKILSNNCSKKSHKVVKNFNEFLNFTNKSRISDKLTENTAKILKAKTFDRQNSENYKCIMVTNECIDILNNSRPIIKLTQKSVDESCALENELILRKKNEINFETEEKNKKIGDSDLEGESQQIINPSTKEISLQIENLNAESLNNPLKLNETNTLNINVEETDKNLIIKKYSLDIINVNEEQIVHYSNANSNLVSKNFNKQDFVKDEDKNKRISTSSSNNADIFIWENPLHQISRNSTCSLNDIDVNDNRSCDDLNGLGNSLEININNTLVDNLRTETPDEEDELQYDGDTSLNRTEIESKSNVENFDFHHSRISPLNPFLSNYDENEIKVIENLNSQDNYMTSIEVMSPAGKTKFKDLTNEHSTLNDSLIISDIAVDGEENSSKFSVNLNIKSVTFLPPPNEFGGGNPFLIFLSLTLLLQHRNFIMRSNLDYNEMAMHFDKMVRKHDVNRVLNQARRMYFEYLKNHNTLGTTASSIDNSKASITNIDKKL